MKIYSEEELKFHKKCDIAFVIVLVIVFCILLKVFIWIN